MGLALWLEAERGRFILFLPVAMLAAILLYFALKFEPPLWLAAALPAVALVLLAAVWRWPVARFGAALLLAFCLGFGRAEWRTAAQPPLLVLPHGAPQITGRITAVDPLPVGRRITLTAPQLNADPKLARDLRIRLRDTDPAALTVGQTVSLRAELFAPDRPAFPGAWDFGRADYFDGLGASGFALGDVAILAQAPPDALASGLRRLREAIAARILAVLPTPTGAVAVTLLTGFEQVIPAPERQNFIAAGLAHILAVAGLHVGIVMGLCFGLTRFALTRSERLTLRLPVKACAALAALAAGGAYALLTGAHLPILRSLAMASLVTLGVLAGRRAISLRGLALAATAIMLTTPEAVVGVSFQMSFSAVAALIAGYDAARGYFARAQRGGRLARFAGHVAALAFTSLLAGGASMPFAAYQFQQIQPYWIFANLIAVPLTALWIMPCGLLALALMPLGLDRLALIPMGWGIGIIVWLTTRIAAWPDAMLSITRMPAAAILCFTAGLIWLCLWRGRPRLAGLAPMLVALWLALAARPPDVLVSADARLVAARTATGVLLFRAPRAASYTLASWRPVWPGGGFLTLDPAAPPPGAVCDTAGCALARPGVFIVLGPPAGDCGTLQLVISPEPLRGACRAPGRLVIDRFTVWRQGAVAVWFTRRGPELLTDRQVQGSRPWVPAWPVHDATSR
jgi:competence protein ComEC